MRGMRSSGPLMCIASAAAFGAMGVFGKLAYGEGATVGTLLAVRFALAALLFWALIAGRGALRGARRAATSRSGSASAPAATRSRRAATSPRSSGSTPRCCRCCSTRSRRSSPSPPSRSAASGSTRARSRRWRSPRAGWCSSSPARAPARSTRSARALGLAAALVYSAYILVSQPLAARIRPDVLATLVCTGAAVSLALGAGADRRSCGPAR